jgi:methionyl aminopeptidase
MIFFKNEEEVACIRKSACILSQALGILAKEIRPGITTKSLDKIAEDYIKDQHAIPSFKGYENFPSSLCISVNNEVAHGIPGKYVIKEGDIVSVDCGVFYQGMHSDSAYTFSVGETKKEAADLLKITKEALYLGIDEAITGKRTGDIGNKIETHVLKNGYSIVKILAGHGVGFHLHEDPDILNYGRQGTGVKLKKGMVIAIEPIVNMGYGGVRTAADKFTILTADNKLSAHFEHTVAVLEKKAEILTTFDYIEEALKQN